MGAHAHLLAEIAGIGECGPGYGQAGNPTMAATVPNRAIQDIYILPGRDLCGGSSLVARAIISLGF